MKEKTSVKDLYCVDGFYEGLKKQPLLSKKREKELSSKVQNSKDEKEREEALVELINSNLFLVMSQASKYAIKSKYSIKELYNIGRMGLICAAYKYDSEEFDTRFSTYAVLTIRGSILDYIRGDNQVKIPSSILDKLIKKSKMMNEEKMSENEVEKSMELNAKCKFKIKQADVKCVSLNSKIQSSDGDFDIIDVIPDKKAKIPGDFKFKHLDFDFDKLQDAFRSLDKKSKIILISHVLKKDKETLEETGLKLNMSGERVRQKKNKALKILRDKLIKV